jgi:predicted ABC-type transport system involved in lysophospholipase L1 biosynthesis ATPase subunit
MSSVLLELEQVRCCRDDVTLLDNVTLHTSTKRVGLSGKTEGVFALLRGQARLTSGQFNVLGRPLEVARSERIFGCALPPLGVPPKWTLRQVLELAAEAAGHSRRESTKRAAAAMAQIGESQLLKCQWSRASAIERALGTLALGLLTEPAALFIRLPLGELRDQEVVRYSTALARAVEGLFFAVELARPASHNGEARWTTDLDEIAYVFEAGVAGNWSPETPGKVRYLVRVVGDSDRLAKALLGAGITARAIQAPSDCQLGRSAFLVDVDRDSSDVANTGPLLDVCLALELEVLELSPIGLSPVG